MTWSTFGEAIITWERRSNRERGEDIVGEKIAEESTIFEFALGGRVPSVTSYLLTHRAPPLTVAVREDHTAAYW